MIWPAGSTYVLKGRIRERIARRRFEPRRECGARKRSTQMTRIDPIHRVAASVIGCVFMLGCSAASDEGTTGTEAHPGAAGIDYAASAPPGATLEAGLPSAAAALEFGQVEGDKMLAKVDVTDTHSVTFWQVKSGRVIVIESYNVDKNPAVKPTNFRAGGDSYADTYTALAGAAAKPDALTNLRAADAFLAKAKAERPASTRATPNQGGVNAVPRVSSPITTDGLTFKSANDDMVWFQNQICAPRSSSSRGQDADNCFVTPLFIGQSTTTWNVDFETANIALFDADSSTNATLQVTSVNCEGPFGLGLCDELVAHSVTTPPRIVNVLSAEADDRFLTTASGNDYAVHYLFWD
jgi:hypothetical protein